ncbi:sulfotransferase [bacterium]|nr:sulfotransferase [bacterium]
MTDELKKKTYYFMAGLPRSGSTILSAILNQNPDIYSGPSSPISGLMVQLENYMANDELFLAYPKIEQAKQIISNTLTHYYSDVTKPIIIDKNRSWVNRLDYISNYFGIYPKVLCPVRNIDEILTSFISMHRRNPYETNGKINFIDEILVKNNIPLTDDNRCELLASDSGILGQSYIGLKDALLKGHEKQLHFIEYNDLIKNPEETMKKIYDFLELPYFKHDFNNLINLHQEDDTKIYGIPDMHSVRKELKSTSLNPEEVLSERILNQCKNAEFWRNLTEVKFDDTYHEEESNETKALDSNSNLIG